MHISKIIDSNSLAREPEQTSGIISEVVSRVSDLKDFYPQFDSWISEKVVPGIAAGDRTLLVEYRAANLAALAILKDDGLEKKLCCLRVLPGFENAFGMGVRLFEKAFDVLGTDRPLLSVAEERLQPFSRVFKHFGFESYAEYADRYRLGKVEYSFNGLLDVPVVEGHSVISTLATEPR